MSDNSAGCTLERRREDVRQSKFLGIDFVEVGPSQTTLEVFFLGKAPASLSAANISITGGSPVSVVGIHIYRQKDPTLDDWMEVTVNTPGNFSDYTFAIVALDKNGNQTDQPMAGLDPLFATATFNFKVSCPTGLDCCAPQVCPPPTRTAPDINYLAKDYASFLQLMLDRLAQTAPAWTETHVPDIGVMLVQLLAYVGDQLSYYQDAVATEAYLGTARERISVRRHARLVDYHMHEGCNARAWVTIWTSADIALSAGTFYFCTPFPGAPSGHMLKPADLAKAPPGTYQVFQPLQQDPTQATVLKQAHNAIQFYTWGDCACCLPVGATSATLLDRWVTTDAGMTRALALSVNDVLIFEEVIGPGTGNPADADPRHRKAVRLTSVTQSVDQLYNPDGGGTPIVEIEWCSEDALTFPLCISAVMPPPDCTCKTGISIARGNIILVDNGITVTETLGTVPTETSTPLCPTDCCPPTVVVTPGPFCPVLQQIPLTFAVPLPVCYCATPILVQDPRQALPSISLTGTVATSQGNNITTTWTPLADLLESGPNDANFVVEIDNAGKAHLRFANGDEGKMPDAGTSFTATYRVGNGTDGNVGAETIVNIVSTEIGVTLLPRNPLPASGGIAQESMNDVRFFAPYSFQDVLERAITADDYATLAADNARRLEDRPDLMPPPAPAPLPIPPEQGTDPREGEEEEGPPPTPPLPADLCLIPFEPLQNAKCTLRWTGSWYEALVAVDPLGSESVSDELLNEIDAYLEPYRRIGHDLAVSAADYVALDLGLSICVAPNYQRGQIEATLLAALGTGVLPNGKLALFNPDNLTFGSGVYVSPIIAAVQLIPGVIEVQLTRLAPYLPGTPAPTTKPDFVPKNGVLTLGPFQIPRLDNDPNAPANGRLTLLLRGGR